MSKPKKKLQQKLERALKENPTTKPWNLLDPITPPAPQYEYPLRTGTMPTSIRLYGPILAAATLFHRDIYDETEPCFCMVVKKGFQKTEVFLEAAQPDGSSLLIAFTDNQDANKSDTLRLSVVEQDGTRAPSVSFADMDEQYKGFIVLALMPKILSIDAKDGGGKIASAITRLGSALDTAVAAPWNNSTEIPDIAKEAAYYTDAIISVIGSMDLDCGQDTSDIPAEIDDTYFKNGGMTGPVICKNMGVMGNNGWIPLVVVPNGKATNPYSTSIGILTIAEAKAQFASFSADRHWTAAEESLIPQMPEDMPVMPEVMYMANRIVNTHNDLSPVSNGMWRGETGFGKSTGMLQLACILHTPFLVQTCHPAMEAQDFISTFVPKTDLSDADELYEDEPTPTSTPSPSQLQAAFEDALSYVRGLPSAERNAVIGETSDFISTALMDQEQAETMLFGSVVNADLPDLLRIYNEVCLSMQKAEFENKLQKASQNSEKTIPSGPNFIHVTSPYIRAMTKGYILEIQEVSRIRDSAVMVALNDFDKPGATLQLSNGKMATRHTDAICVITDNVGYSSCRPIDPSVIRRQSFIIDSYDLPKEILQDRAKRNEGVTDQKLLDTAYDLWKCVREYCEQNSITEGSVSPVEYERFIQAVRDDGPDSIAVNLDRCIISKATSSIEDQRDIRTACQTLISKT